MFEKSTNEQIWFLSSFSYMRGTKIGIHLNKIERIAYKFKLERQAISKIVLTVLKFEISRSL